ncbi:GNAT family N-acetyltransferase [Shewanella sp. 10N.286.54.B9]|uniref:GNAT family N-acetyltransferase n=1 Tax=Shewanella sp. 10N.286.54.B9 TaxID=3229719 RepID=UPI0035528612
MSKRFNVRLFKEQDVAQLANLFHLSITQAAASHYSAAERAAWSPALRSDDEWLVRLAPTVTWVAEEEGIISGFINLKPTIETLGSDGESVLSAEVDCLFTHPDFVGQGVASQLYQCLEQYAIVQKISALTVEASYLAKPFFEKQGYQVLSKNEHSRADQVLVNFSMQKILNTSP